MGPKVVPEIIDDGDLKEEVLKEPGETQPRTRGIVHLPSETQIVYLTLLNSCAYRQLFLG